MRQLGSTIPKFSITFHVYFVKVTAIVTFMKPLIKLVDSLSIIKQSGQITHRPICLDATTLIVV